VTLTYLFHLSYVVKDNDGDERLTAVNLLICLVARYFGQSDLSDASWHPVANCLWVQPI